MNEMMSHLGFIKRSVKEGVREETRLALGSPVLGWVHGSSFYFFLYFCQGLSFSVIEKLEEKEKRKQVIRTTLPLLAR